MNSSKVYSILVITNTNGNKWDLRVTDKNVISKILILHETDFKNTNTIAFVISRDLEDDREMYIQK